MSNDIKRINFSNITSNINNSNLSPNSYSVEQFSKDLTATITKIKDFKDAVNLQLVTGGIDFAGGTCSTAFCLTTTGAELLEYASGGSLDLTDAKEFCKGASIFWSQAGDNFLNMIKSRNSEDFKTTLDSVSFLRPVGKVATNVGLDTITRGVSSKVIFPISTAGSEMGSAYKRDMEILSQNALADDPAKSNRTLMKIEQLDRKQLQNIIYNNYEKIDQMSEDEKNKIKDALGINDVQLKTSLNDILNNNNIPDDKLKEIANVFIDKLELPDLYNLNSQLEAWSDDNNILNDIKANPSKFVITRDIDDLEDIDHLPINDLRKYMELSLSTVSGLELTKADGTTINQGNLYTKNEDGTIINNLDQISDDEIVNNLKPALVNALNDKIKNSSITLNKNATDNDLKEIARLATKYSKITQNHIKTPFYNKRVETLSDEQLNDLAKYTPKEVGNLSEEDLRDYAKICLEVSDSAKQAASKNGIYTVDDINNQKDVNVIIDIVKDSFNNNDLLNNIGNMSKENKKKLAVINLKTSDLAKKYLDVNVNVYNLSLEEKEAIVKDVYGDKMIWDTYNTDMVIGGVKGALQVVEGKISGNINREITNIFRASSKNIPIQAGTGSMFGMGDFLLDTVIDGLHNVNLNDPKDVLSTGKDMLSTGFVINGGVSGLLWNAGINALSGALGGYKNQKTSEGEIFKNNNYRKHDKYDMEFIEKLKSANPEINTSNKQERFLSDELQRELLSTNDDEIKKIDGIKTGSSAVVKGADKVAEGTSDDRKYNDIVHEEQNTEDLDNQGVDYNRKEVNNIPWSQI